MKNITFLILAIGLSLLLLPFGIIYTTVKYIINPRNVWGNFTDFMLKWALSIDGLGNVMLASLLNDLMITKDGYHFGNWHETISQVLGDNLLNGTLTKQGHFLSRVLDKIFETNHCDNAMRNKKLRCIKYIRRLDALTETDEL